MRGARAGVRRTPGGPARAAAAPSGPGGRRRGGRGAGRAVAPELDGGPPRPPAAAEEEPAGPGGGGRASGTGREWGLWPALPLQPGAERATTLEELVPGKIFALEQLYGTLDVLVNVRMTVVVLREGGLFLNNPVAPTGECMRMLRGLEARFGAVKYVVLSTTAVEHKVYLGPMARQFPEAEVFAAPKQWSIPPLPNRFLGFPARTQFLAEDATGMPWEGEFDQAILDIPLGVGPYLEYAFFHKPTRTLLVTDVLVRVPRDPPRVNAEHGLAALLNRAKNDSKDVVPDTPEGRRIGWQKTVLFAFFLQPACVDFDVTDVPGFLIWNEGWESSFDAIAGQLLVPPIVQVLCISKGKRKTRAWVDRICKWNFQRIVSAHLDGVVPATPSDVRVAFDFLRDEGKETVLEKALASLAGNFAQQKTGVVFPEAEMGALNGIDSLVQASGLAPPGDE